MLTLQVKMTMKNLIQWMGYGNPVATYNIWRKNKPHWNLLAQHAIVDTRQWLEKFSVFLKETPGGISNSARVKIAAELSAPTPMTQEGCTPSQSNDNVVIDVTPQPEPPLASEDEVPLVPDEVMGDESTEIPVSNNSGAIFDDSPLEIFTGQEVGTGLDLQQQILVNDWTLVRYGQEEEPRVSDLELARHLQYAKPRDIRTLIKNMIAENRLPGHVLQRLATRRYESKTGIWQEREEESYHVTEEQSLLIASQSGTTKGIEVTLKLIRIYTALKKFFLRQVAQVTRPQGMVTVEEVAGLIKTTLEAVTQTMLPQFVKAVADLLDKRFIVTPVTPQPAPPPPVPPRAPVVRLDSRRKASQENQPSLFPTTPTTAPTHPKKKPFKMPAGFHWLKDVIAATSLPPESLSNLCYRIGLYRNHNKNPIAYKVDSPSDNGTQSWIYSDEAIRIIYRNMKKPYYR